jgi:hypothetical protein
MPEDLWPSNIADSKLVPPVALLREQAALLGRKTRQLIDGEVTTDTTGALFVHHFYIAAPTLQYRFELFTVSHGVTFYPLTRRHLNRSTAAASENEFKEKLQEIFADQHTLNVVHSILAQVQP